MKRSFSHKLFRRFVIFVKILKLFKLVFIKSVGYERPMTPLGSFISQEEVELSWKSDLPLSLLGIFECVEILEPIQRIGGSGDGSYILAGNQFNDCLLVSGGISNNNEFELELANMGATGFQFDGSISHPPKLHERLGFRQVYVGRRFGFLNLQEMTREGLEFMSMPPRAKILKLDIEGSEWDLLAGETLADFDQIIIEMHGLFEVMRINGNLKLQVLNNLVDNFYTIYANGNNCCGFTNIGGYPIPNIAEFSFVNKKKFTRKGAAITNPSPIVNIPGRPPLRIWGMGN